MCGILGFCMGALRWDSGGRAVLQPVNGAILAHCCRFRNDEPKHEVNLARSLFVQLKHAQTSLRAPPAFQARIEEGQSAEEDGVFHVKHYP